MTKREQYLDNCAVIRVQNTATITKIGDKFYVNWHKNSKNFTLHEGTTLGEAMELVRGYVTGGIK